MMQGSIAGKPVQHIDTPAGVKVLGSEPGSLTTSKTPSPVRGLDKYYTTDATARKCVGILWRAIQFRANHRFIEPSAGAGAFCRHLPAARLISLDIAPEAPDIQTADFLSFTPPPYSGRSIVIGNPPFGKGGRMARRFINQGARFADVVAFILPVSFSRTSMQRGIDPYFHLLQQVDLPNEPFHVADGLHRVSCVFQIWMRRPELRIAPIARTAHPDFRFVGDPSEADVIIRRTGSLAGKLLPLLGRNHIKGQEPPSGYASSSNYYIRAVRCSAKGLHDRLSMLPLKKAAASAIQPSLAKADIVSLYERALGVPAEQHDGEPAKSEQDRSSRHSPAPNLGRRQGKETMALIYGGRHEDMDGALRLRGTPWADKAPPDDGDIWTRLGQEYAGSSWRSLPQSHSTVKRPNDTRTIQHSYPSWSHAMSGVGWLKSHRNAHARLRASDRSMPRRRSPVPRSRGMNLSPASVAPVPDTAIGPRRRNHFLPCSRVDGSPACVDRLTTSHRVSGAWSSESHSSRNGRLSVQWSNSSFRTIVVHDGAIALSARRQSAGRSDSASPEMIFTTEPVRRSNGPSAKMYLQGFRHASGQIGGYGGFKIDASTR